jgi:SAM-dependent methyltransferase
MSQPEPAAPGAGLDEPHHPDPYDVTDGGERVTPECPNDCFVAHLSIYAFAAPLAQGGVMLDAGCGTGYGSHYLAGHGARSVVGVDASAKAVAFAARRFARANLAYRVMDLERIDGFPDGHFDLIFSSNVLEHLADVRAFFRTARRLLKPTGALLVAVPPITNDLLRDLNLSNAYHLNIWSPRQWHHALRMYFDEVQYHGHLPRPGAALDFGPVQGPSRYTVADFLFPAVPAEQMAKFASLTSIFVAGRPVLEARLPEPRQPMTFVDDSFTRPSPFVDPAEAARTARAVEAVQAALQGGPKPAPQPAARRAPLLRRAWEVARRHGPRAFVARSARFAAKRLVRLLVRG